MTSGSRPASSEACATTPPVFWLRFQVTTLMRGVVGGGAAIVVTSNQLTLRPPVAVESRITCVPAASGSGAFAVVWNVAHAPVTGTAIGGVGVAPSTLN